MKQTMKNNLVSDMIMKIAACMTILALIVSLGVPGMMIVRASEVQTEASVETAVSETGSSSQEEEEAESVSDDDESGFLDIAVDMVVSATSAVQGWFSSETHSEEYEEYSSSSSTYEKSSKSANKNLAKDYACPFEKKEGRTIVVFPHDEIAGYEPGTRKPHQIPYVSMKANIAPGTYTVHTHSYDEGHDRGEETAEYNQKYQSKEQWYVHLYNGENKFKTFGPTTDVPDGNDYDERFDEFKVEVTENVTKVVAYHAFPDERISSVVPNCVAFDKHEEEKPEVKTLSCPIPAKEGRTIIDFTEGGKKTLSDLVIYADRGEAATVRGPWSVSVGAGTYDVILASYDDHYSQDNDYEPGEAWKAYFLNEAGEQVAISAPNDDIPDGQDYHHVRVNEGLHFASDIKKVKAVHAYHPNDIPKSHAPVCIGLDKKEPPVTGDDDDDTTPPSGDDDDDDATPPSGDDDDDDTPGGGGGRCMNCDDDDDDDDNGRGDDDDDTSPNIVLSSDYTPSAPEGFITLDQVPYTGFEAGPILTALFWTVVLGFSVLVAWILTVMQPYARLSAYFNGSATPTFAGEASHVFTQRVVAPVSEPQTLVYATPAHASFAVASGSESIEDKIEERVHKDNILLSPEALRAVVDAINSTGVELDSFVDGLVEDAKAQYAREDGWILLSKERVAHILSLENASPVEEKVAVPSEPVVSPVQMAPRKEAPNNPSRPTLKPQTPVQSAIKEVMNNNTHNSPGALRAEGNPETVATFVTWIAQNEQQKVFQFLRKLGSQGYAVENFIGQVVRGLDEVYKQRIEGGRTPDATLAQTTATWSNGDLEVIIGTLVECVDFSYSNNRIGAKVALAKVFEFIDSKKEKKV